MKVIRTTGTLTKGERIGKQSLIGQECKVVHRLPHDPYVLCEFPNLKDKTQKGIKFGWTLQWYVHENDLSV